MGEEQCSPGRPLLFSWYVLLVSHLIASDSLQLSSRFLGFEAAHLEHPLFSYRHHTLYSHHLLKKISFFLFLLLCVGLQVDGPAVLGHPCLI